MKPYIGTKIIQAEPADGPGFTDEDGCQHPGKPGYKVVYPDGYESWSPAATFEQAHRPIRLMSEEELHHAWCGGSDPKPVADSDELVAGAVEAASDGSSPCEHDFSGTYEPAVDSRRCRLCNMLEEDYLRTQPHQGD